MFSGTPYWSIGSVYMMGALVRKVGQRSWPIAGRPTRWLTVADESCRCPKWSGGMQPWWEAFAGRVEYEYACLDAAGIAYILDEEAADRGVLQLRVSRMAYATVDVVVTFPDLYPFFRPAVRMADPQNSFQHHRQPFSGDLCLLGRDTARWGTYDTVGLAAH